MPTTPTSLNRHRALGLALLMLLCLLAVGRSALGTRLASFTIDAGTPAEKIPSIRNPWLE